MKRILLWMAALLLAGQAFAYSGSGGVWATKCGDFVAKNFAGTQAGIDAAVAYCGSCGFLQIGAGLESLSPTTPPSVGVTISRADSSGWTVSGKGIVTGRLGPSSGPTWGGAIRIVDGVTFDSDSLGIREALDELASAGGGKLIVPKGIYLIGSPILLPSNTELDLLSGAILRATSSTLPDFPWRAGLSAVLVIPPGGSNVSIHGGEIDGVWHGGGGTTTSGIFADSASTGVSIRDVFLHNMGWSGALLRGTRHFISSCRTDSNGIAGLETNGSQIVLSGNHCKRDGLATEGVGGIDIEGRSMNGLTQQTDVQVIGGSIVGGRMGVYLGDSLSASGVVGTNVYDTIERGINAVCVGGRDITISGTTVRKTGGRGITINGVTGFKVIGNTIDSASVSNNMPAIYMEGAASQGLVADNYCTNSWVGIGLESPVADVVIGANKLRGNSGANYNNTSSGVRIHYGFNSIGDQIALDLRSAIASSDSARFNSGLYVGGQFLNKILRASATLDFDLTAVTCQDLTITVTGAALGDEVFVGAPNGSIVTDETITAWVSSANTVTVRACDGVLTGNPASGTYKVTVFQ